MTRTTKAGLAMMVLAMFVIGGCERQGPAERAGEKIDNAADKVGDKLDEAKDKARDATN